MARKGKRAAIRARNRIRAAAETLEESSVASEPDDNSECSCAENMLDSEDEDIQDEDLDDNKHTHIAARTAVSHTSHDMPAYAMRTSGTTSSLATSTTSTAYTFAPGIEFAPESTQLLKGTNLLRCTSLDWTNGSSPSKGAIGNSGRGCASDIAELTYGELQTDVKAKNFMTGMKKQKSNINPASTAAIKSWGPTPPGYRKIRDALFNGGAGGRNHYGGGRLSMIQTTTGVVEHEYMHGESVEHSNRWRPLRKGEKRKRRETYKLINGEWNIFESSRDGFCSIMSIYGKRKRLPVPIMYKTSYKYQQLALHDKDKPSIVYNLQDAMATKRDGVVNGVKIILGDDQQPLYLGRYTSNLKKKGEPTTLLAFHTETGKRGMGSTRWMMGASGLFFTDVGVYAKVVNNSDDDVWQVEVGKITEEATSSAPASKRVRLTQ